MSFLTEFQKPGHIYVIIMFMINWYFLPKDTTI